MFEGKRQAEFAVAHPAPLLSIAKWNAGLYARALDKDGAFDLHIVPPNHRARRVMAGQDFLTRRHAKRYEHAAKMSYGISEQPVNSTRVIYKSPWDLSF